MLNRVFVFAAAAVASAPALGSVAEINPAYPVTVNGPTAGMARYRASHTNWDQALIRGTTPSNAQPANSFIGFGAPLSLSVGREYGFRVQNIPGEGVVFAMDDLTTGTADDFIVSWGNVTSVPAGTNRVTIDSVTPFDTYYNALHIYARTQNRGSAGVATQDNRVAWRDISFTSSLANTGSFFDGELDAIPAGDLNPLDDLDNFFSEQWVVTQIDMRSIAWTLSAKVTLDSDTLSGGVADPPSTGEGLKFEIGFKNVIPTPGAVSLAGLAALAGLRRRR
jgi:hypothetical protein